MSVFVILANFVFVVIIGNQLSLPVPLAYSITAQYNDTYYIIGGRNAVTDGSFNLYWNGISNRFVYIH